MRTSWINLLAILTPAVLAAAPAPAARSGEVPLVEAAVAGSVVGAVIEGERVPPALEVDRSAGARKPPRVARRRGSPSSASAQSRISPPLRRAERRSASTQLSAAPPAMPVEHRGQRRGGGAVAGASWGRDLTIMIGSGIAGALMLVGGSRRKRRRYLP